MTTPAVVTPGLFRFHRFVAVLTTFLLAALCTAAAASKKVIIDTDPGTDDALAIMLALNSPELDVRALTVVPGNVTLEMGVENALRMVSLARSLRHSGRRRSFSSPVSEAHHRPVLAWQERPRKRRIARRASAKQNPMFGPDLIIKLVHDNPHEITLIPVGPLTNIALAVEKDPSIIPLVKDVVIMGGSITGGT